MWDKVYKIWNYPNIIWKNKRATKDKEKEEVISKILSVWKNNPELRLGQLIEIIRSFTESKDLFYIEDYELVKIFDKFNFNSY